MNRRVAALAGVVVVAVGVTVPLAAGGLDVGNGATGTNGSDTSNVGITPGGVCVTDNGQGVTGGQTHTTVNIGDCPTSTTSTSSTTTTTTSGGGTTTTSTTMAGNRTLLSLRAIVVNRFGGTATPADFDLFARGPITISGTTDSPSVTRALVPPGTYDLSDVQDALAEATDPYTTSGWDCTDSAATTPESVTLDAGEAGVCVVVFSDAPVPTGTPAAPGTPGSVGTPGTASSGSGGSGSVGSPSSITLGTVPAGQPGAGETITAGNG